MSLLHRNVLPRPGRPTRMIISFWRSTPRRRLPEPCGCTKFQGLPDCHAWWDLINWGLRICCTICQDRSQFDWHRPHGFCVCFTIHPICLPWWQRDLLAPPMMPRGRHRNRSAPVAEIQHELRTHCGNQGRAGHMLL